MTAEKTLTEAQFQKKCSIEGCDEPIIAKRLCRSHYEQVRTKGHITSNLLQKKDGKMKHPLYRTWAMMRSRCNYPGNSAYDNYGKRGIKVCERWNNVADGFWNFVEDMGNRPIGYTLDRIDVNGDYCPQNCRWATRHQQNSNKRNNLTITNIYLVKKDIKRKYRVNICINGHKMDRSYQNLEEAIKARDIFVLKWENI